MKKALFIEKLGMTQYISEDGQVSPVTAVRVLDQEVVSFKTDKKHGYNSVVVGYKSVSDNKLNNPQLNFFKKLNKPSYKNLSEIRLDSDVFSSLIDNSVDSLCQFKLQDFNVDESVTVQGISKGKGFQGTIKQGFRGGPNTHGSKNKRQPGSIGAGTDPARCFKGITMAKRLGNKTVTVKNLTIASVDLNNSVAFIVGSLPGRRHSILLMYN